MPKDTNSEMKAILDATYITAERIVENDQQNRLLKYPEAEVAYELAGLKHAFRGAAVTLLAYKLASPDQDIRAHKDEQEGGFSARSYDSRITIPFLIEKSLPRSVESHWLTQTISFAGILDRNQELKTAPRKSGPLLIEVLNLTQELGRRHKTYLMLLAIMTRLIEIRNQDKVITTKPKSLPIDAVKYLLDSHFSRPYKANSPRLPQLAIFAIYQCLLENVIRFSDQSLEDLGRMKAADRKSGTVGDVVVLQKGQPVEAVEIKYGQPISYIHVCEAIDKVRGASVNRYYLLSTNGVAEDDVQQIDEKKIEFLHQNGCEIIVNGVIETVGYYLRLLPDTTEFLHNYATLVEIDDDTAYEHRIAWNEVCQTL
ncbi:hypothetical protein OAS69_01240 [Pseudomonadales bacterium]|nr:hypothetical protein [Pseudomonadales bacterium]